MLDPSARPQSWFDAPAWPLGRWLLLVFAMRLPAIFFADGFEFVDQQYQYVDPAWHMATGQAWYQPWEWVEGIRSSVYPWLLAWLFQVLAAVGFEDPDGTLRAVRAVHALASLLPAWLFWSLVVRWRPIAMPRRALLLFALSGLMIAGVQPSGPTLAISLSLAAAIAVEGGVGLAFMGGLCLGLAFCMRFQDALFGPGILLALLWRRRFAAAAAFAAGCVPGICVQGFVDLAEHGTFLATPWRYLRSNVEFGAADKWTQQPFWFYWLVGVVPLVGLLPPFVRVAWQRLRAGAFVLPAATLGALGHLLAHSFIARKAMRFEYPALAMLVGVVAVGMSAASGRWPQWHGRWLAFVHVLTFGYASFWAGNLGAVRAAHWLRDQPAFDGRVLVVGGDATSLGGYFHLRPPADHAVGTTLVAFADAVRREQVPAAQFVVAVRHPLPVELADAAGLELAATFCGQWNLRGGERRFVYRWRR
ncbi:MAG: hypothetical protein JNK15_15485 [Planctomycetes bacterium]|nr:hypothetical protein [Planctomycetota bacterium]